MTWSTYRPAAVGLLELYLETAVTLLWGLAAGALAWLLLRRVRPSWGTPRRLVRRAVIRGRWASVVRSAGLAVTRDRKLVYALTGGASLTAMLTGPIDAKRTPAGGRKPAAVERLPRLHGGHATADRRAVTYRVAAARGQTLEDIGERAPALADALRVHRVALRRLGPAVGELTVYLEPAFDRPVPWRPVTLPDAVPWGTDEFGETVAFPLGRGHMLVAAETEGGKSNLVNALVGSLSVRPDVALIGVDVKVTELSPWAARFSALATTGADGQAALDAAAVEVKDRYRRMGALGIRKLDVAHPGVGPFVVIVVDELNEFLAEADRASLLSLARLGRGCGVHLVCATQNPNARVLSSELRDQLVWRWCGRMASTTTAAMVLGEGCPVDPTTIGISQRGVGVVVDHLGPPRLARSWLMTDEQVAEIAAGTAALRHELPWLEPVTS